MVSELLAGVPVRSVVTAAVRAAWSQSAPEPVDTWALLVWLMRADTYSAWERIWLYCGDADAITRKPVRDAATSSSRTWNDVPLTAIRALSGSMSAGLSPLVTACGSYPWVRWSWGLSPIPSPVPRRLCTTGWRVMRCWTSCNRKLLAHR